MRSSSAIWNGKERRISILSTYVTALHQSTQGTESISPAVEGKIAEVATAEVVSSRKEMSRERVIPCMKRFAKHPSLLFFYATRSL